MCDRLTISFNAKHFLTLILFLTISKRKMRLTGESLKCKNCINNLIATSVLNMKKKKLWYVCVYKRICCFKQLTRECTWNISLVFSLFRRAYILLLVEYNDRDWCAAIYGDQWINRSVVNVRVFYSVVWYGEP